MNSKSTEETCPSTKCFFLADNEAPGNKIFNDNIIHAVNLDKFLFLDDADKSCSMIFRAYSTMFYKNKIKYLEDFEDYVNCDFNTFKAFVWNFFQPNIDFNIIQHLPHEVIEKLYPVDTAKIANSPKKTSVFNIMKIYLFQIQFKLIPDHAQHFVPPKAEV